MTAIDCTGRTIREINSGLKERIAAGETEIELLHPGARHNLAVAVLAQATVRIRGSAGYYCGGLSDGATVEIDGSAGWGLAESMLSGTVVVRRNAGNGAAAAIRGGTVVIHGNAASRLGVSMKGGLVLVGGNCDYMAGFMGQKGTMIICGDAGEAFADSMYSTVCLVGGKVADLGNDAVIEPLSDEDVALIESSLAKHFGEEERRAKPPAREFKKVVAGKKLWNFSHRDWKTWQEAL
ncbi:MAG: glutamate synthase [Bryobacteraceae bacterium]